MPRRGIPSSTQFRRLLRMFTASSPVFLPRVFLPGHKGIDNLWHASKQFQAIYFPLQVISLSMVKRQKIVSIHT